MIILYYGPFDHSIHIYLLKRQGQTGSKLRTKFIIIENASAITIKASHANNTNQDVPLLFTLVLELSKSW